MSTIHPGPHIRAVFEKSTGRMKYYYPGKEGLHFIGFSQARNDGVFYKSPSLNMFLKRGLISVV